MNLVERFDHAAPPHPRKTQESNHCPQYMFGDDGLIWISLIIVSIGNSFHRMGPSFERGRFGFPLMLLGLTFLIFLPSEFSEERSVLHESILQSISIALPFAIGAIIILRNSPTYGERSILGLVTGWIMVIVSWAVILSEKDTFSILGFARGALVFLGVLVGLIAILIGSHVVERSSGLRDESEPLSIEEGALVRTILERRLGGD